nr:hypothetical protein [uncultured Blautia sp.]
MNYKKLLIVLTAVTALGMAGCGKSSKETAEVTPTPVPTAAPTAAPATSTPLLTSTPAPKLIGVKTSTAKFVYLTNSTKGEIREIYLRAAGGEEWGKNLVPAEATIKAAEQVQMYYTSDSAKNAIYDMKIVDGDGNAYEIYSVQLSDMEKAKLMIDNGEAYLTYTSLSEKSEKSTIGNVETDNSVADSSDSADSTDASDLTDSSSGITDTSSDNSDGSYDNSDGSDDSSDDGSDDSSDDGSDDGGDYVDDSSNSGSGDDSLDNSTDDSGDGGIIWDDNGDWSEE